MPIPSDIDISNGPGVELSPTADRTQAASAPLLDLCRGPAALFTLPRESFPARDMRRLESILLPFLARLRDMSELMAADYLHPTLLFLRSRKRWNATAPRFTRKAAS